MRCKHPFKIDLQRLLTNLTLQLRDPPFRPALLSIARALAGTLAASGAARWGLPPTPALQVSQRKRKRIEEVFGWVKT
jgi:hypothetical protein